jgi:hypothetical protein
MSAKTIFTTFATIGLFAGCATTCFAETQTAPKQSFFLSARHAEFGDGHSRVSSFIGPKSTNYFVNCNCADMSSASKVCPNKGYQCVCSPASIYCQ